MSSLLHRLTRFRLRTLLIVVTVLCIYIGWNAAIVRPRVRMLAELERTGGLIKLVPLSDDQQNLSLVRRWLGDQLVTAKFVNSCTDYELAALTVVFPETKVSVDAIAAAGGISVKKIPFQIGMSIEVVESVLGHSSMRSVNTSQWTCIDHHVAERGPGFLWARFGSGRCWLSFLDGKVTNIFVNCPPTGPEYYSRLAGDGPAFGFRERMNNLSALDEYEAMRELITGPPPRE